MEEQSVRIAWLCPGSNAENDSTKTIQSILLSQWSSYLIHIYANHMARKLYCPSPAGYVAKPLRGLSNDSDSESAPSRLWDV
jgi:hypothetical protein